MTQRLFFILTILLLATTSANADQDVTFNLNNANGLTETKSLLDFAKMTVEARNDGTVTVSIENITDGYAFLIFKQNYTTKKDQIKDNDLKKELHLKKIKCSNSSLSQPNGTLSCRRITNNILIPARETFTIIPAGVIRIKNGESDTVNVPIHTCKAKTNDKDGRIEEVELVAREVFNIAIHIDLGPDVVFEKLNKEYNKFIDDIRKDTFCKNKSHQPNFKTKQNEYNKRAKIIRDSVNQNSPTSVSIMPFKYKNIKNQLDSVCALVNDTSSALWIDCGDHHIPQKCSNCQREKRKCKYGCRHNSSCKCKEPPCNICKGTCRYKGITWKSFADWLNGMISNYHHKNIPVPKRVKNEATIRKKHLDGKKDDGYKGTAIDRYNTLLKM